MQMTRARLVYAAQSSFRSNCACSPGAKHNPSLVETAWTPAQVWSTQASPNLTHARSKLNQVWTTPLGPRHSELGRANPQISWNPTQTWSSSIPTWSKPNRTRLSPTPWSEPQHTALIRRPRGRNTAVLRAERIQRARASGDSTRDACIASAARARPDPSPSPPADARPQNAKLLLVEPPAAVLLWRRLGGCSRGGAPEYGAGARGQPDVGIPKPSQAPSTSLRRAPEDPRPHMHTTQAERPPSDRRTHCPIVRPTELHTRLRVVSASSY